MILIGIVIVAHGTLAQEFLSAVKYVVGDVPAARAISMELDHDRGVKTDEICRAADEVDQGHGVIVVADMFGSSPSNLSLPACQPADRCIIYGANLPMLIKLAKVRHLDVPQAVQQARDAGRRYLDFQALGGAA